MSQLQIPPAEFRKLADQVTDLCAKFLESLDAQPSFPETSGEETERLFRCPVPEEGLGAAALEMLPEVLNHSRVPSPRFFGYVFGSGENVAGLGDYFASILNQNVTAWRSAPAAITIERTVVSWLAEAIGCQGFRGSLCGGGSSANLMALAMAREAKAPANEDGAQPAVVYTSVESHMSISKAAALLGLGRSNVRMIPVDDAFRMKSDELVRAIEEDLSAGRKPMAIVASAGTVTTGSIDPLDAIAEIAHKYSLWLHVDGAYGALAAIVEPGKFSGLSKADSLSLDPHKWLYQPSDCGCLLFKDPGWARVAFSHTGEYARSLSEDPIEGFSFFEESMELSRRFRAMKLWLSIRYHGLAAFREAIRQDLANAQHLAANIRTHPALELLAPVPLSAVCFRYIGEGGSRIEKLDEANSLNARILHKVVHERGRVYISNASIHGKFALRACIVNHRTTQADVEAVVSEVLAAAAEVMAEGK